MTLVGHGWVQMHSIRQMKVESQFELEHTTRLFFGCLHLNIFMCLCSYIPGSSDGCQKDYPILLRDLHWTPIGWSRYIYIQKYSCCVAHGSENIINISMGLLPTSSNLLQIQCLKIMIKWWSSMFTGAARVATENLQSWVQDVGSKYVVLSSDSSRHRPNSGVGSS